MDDKQIGTKMIEEILNGINDLEERMCEYSEMNAYIYSHNKMFMIASNNLYKTPEYNKQPYTFKYGDYSISDYLKQYT